MPRGGQAWDGQVILRHDFEGGGSYEYRLVTWEGQPRIAFRWNAGCGIADAPQGIRTSITLGVALYPSIIENILPLGVQDETRAFLGPSLANGHDPHAMPLDPNQNYHHPQYVTSPMALLGPFGVFLNNGPGDGAYMIGCWGRQGERSLVLGFRWNGNNADQRGFPIAKGRPIWIVLPWPRQIWSWITS